MTPFTPQKTSHEAVRDAWDKRPDRNTPVPDEPVARGMSNACAECGAADGATERPLDTATALRYAEHLADTLDELEYGNVVHRPTLFVEVAERMRRPETSCAEDSRVFAPALREAVEATGSNPLLLGRAADLSVEVDDGGDEP